MSSDDIQVTWEVEDGYAGASRPQYTHIPRCDWDDCETDEDREKLVDACVQEDFDQAITWALGEVKQ